MRVRYLVSVLEREYKVRSARLCPVRAAEPQEWSPTGAEFCSSIAFTYQAEKSYVEVEVIYLGTAQRQSVKQKSYQVLYYYLILSHTVTLVLQGTNHSGILLYRWRACPQNPPLSVFMLKEKEQTSPAPCTYADYMIMRWKEVIEVVTRRPVQKGDCGASEMSPAEEPQSYVDMSHMFRLSHLYTLTPVLMETNFPLDLIYNNTLFKKHEKEKQAYSKASTAHCCTRERTGQSLALTAARERKHVMVTLLLHLHKHRQGRKHSPVRKRTQEEKSPYRLYPVGLPGTLCAIAAPQQELSQALPVGHTGVEHPQPPGRA
ncbi:hypothetical protein Nmel_002158 [Mimus melanotis]